MSKLSQQICMNLYGSIQSRRSISFDGGCCDHNYCNKHDPDVSTVVPITGINEAPSPPNIQVSRIEYVTYKKKKHFARWNYCLFGRLMIVTLKWKKNQKTKKTKKKHVNKKKKALKNIIQVLIMCNKERFVSFLTLFFLINCFRESDHARGLTIGSLSRYWC